MPELKGRTLEEIDELFSKKVPAWKFKSYRTTIQEESVADIRTKEGLEDEKNPTPKSLEDAEIKMA